MSNYWRSTLYVWVPVSILLWIVHLALWGDVDMSSYMLAIFVVVIGRVFDAAFGYGT